MVNNSMDKHVLKAVEDIYSLRTKKHVNRFPQYEEEDSTEGIMLTMITKEEYEILKSSGKFKTEEYTMVVFSKDYTCIRQAMVYHVVYSDRVTNTNF